MLFFKLKQKIKKNNNDLEILLLILLVVLLVGGRSISKFHLFGPVYLFDALLFSTFCWSTFQSKNRQRFKLFEVFFIVSIFYLAISVCLRVDKIGYIIRQYALFGYAFMAYVICITIMSNGHKNILSIIRKVGVLSVIIQTIWSIYVLFNGGVISLLSTYKGEYNYYSPLAVLGVLVFASDMIFLAKGTFFRYSLYLYSVFLCLTFGHSSAIIAVLAVGLLAVIKVYRKHLVFIAFLCSLAGVGFSSTAGVKDGNAMWRLMFWGDVAEKIFVDNFAILGEGFGVPYASQGLLYRFAREIKSKGMLKEESKPYLVPMHNSFLTVFFHIGFLPSLLFFVPYIRGFRSFFSLDKETIFLLSTLCSISTWCFFNVILELPHSSIGFWIIYFLLCHRLTNKQEHEYNKFKYIQC